MEHDLYYFSFSILVLVLKLNLVHELNMTLVTLFGLNGTCYPKEFGISCCVYVYTMLLGRHFVYDVY